MVLPSVSFKHYLLNSGHDECQPATMEPVVWHTENIAASSLPRVGLPETQGGAGGMVW